MKTTRNAFAVVLVLIGALAAESALAQGPYRRGYYGGGHWHTSLGISIGVPIGGFAFGYPPYYAPFPYYYPAYYPAPVVVQQPPVYIEQSPAPMAQPSAPAGYWYYCASAGAYYPYVKECPTGWQRVAPQPG